MSDTFDNLLREAAPSATERLRLETGEPTRVVSPKGGRVLALEPLTRQAIIAMVAPVVPPDVRRRLPVEPTVEFEYECAGVGRFAVSIQRAPDNPQQLTVTATPLASSEAPTPPPGSAPNGELGPPVIEHTSQTAWEPAPAEPGAPVIEHTSQTAWAPAPVEPEAPVIEHTSETMSPTEPTESEAPIIEHTSETMSATAPPEEDVPVIEHTSEPLAPQVPTESGAPIIEHGSPLSEPASVESEAPFIELMSETMSAPTVEPEAPAVEPAPAPTMAPRSATLAVDPAIAPGPAGPPAIDALFQRMYEVGASDLHLSVSMAPLVRKDGTIQPLDPSASALEADRLRTLLLEIMPEKNRTEFEKVHDTDFAYEIEGLARFRANVFMDRKGWGAVFRVIPADIMTVEQLGLSSHVLKLCELTKGLVLVTGPTGSGRSTTLTALIDYINKTRSDHIVTIEDPIEFVHENQKCLVNQREVYTHTGGFKTALRAALREDLDVILVGEMRDLETIAIAVETAETGHLVFGTLHTSTAASTVDRMIDQFPPDRQAQIRIMLSESLRGVISQTLCRKIGGGRVAALEILLTNSAISNLIREGKTFQIPSMMQVGRGSGMIALNDSLLELVKNKTVEPEEAYVRSVDKNGLEAQFKRARIDSSFITPEKSE